MDHEYHDISIIDFIDPSAMMQYHTFLLLGLIINVFVIMRTGKYIPLKFISCSKFCHYK